MSWLLFGCLFVLCSFFLMFFGCLFCSLFFFFFFFSNVFFFFFFFKGLMEMMETIEDEKVRVEAMMKVAQLQKKFLNLPFDLVRDSRVIIREGSCLLDDPLHDSLRKAHLFLFSDCVIIATVSGGGGMVGVGGGSGSKYKVRHVLPLYQGEFFEVEAVSVEEDGGEKVWEGFGVRSLVDGEVDLKLYVESGGERDGWVSGLLEAKVCF